ncbi:MAG: hypothetical protein HY514_02205 [Candidatus Aenigmarchaeota archaeon]|nr:hypothetical protein [Candidatus Aenigmarchaeota archaeon]
MSEIEDLIERFFIRGTKHIYDDREDHKAYSDFMKQHTANEEVARRGAKKASIFAKGYKKGELDIELPVVVYFDAAGEVVSHEIYRGPIPRDVLKIRWQDRLLNRI